MPAKCCLSFMLGQLTACERALGSTYFVRPFYFTFKAAEEALPCSR